MKEGRAAAVLAVLDDRRAARQVRVPSFTPAPAVRESHADPAGVRRAGRSRGVASFTAAPVVCESRALRAAGMGGARADGGAVRSVRCWPRSARAPALTAAEGRCESRTLGAGRRLEARARRGVAFRHAWSDRAGTSRPHRRLEPRTPPGADRAPWRPRAAAGRLDRLSSRSARTSLGVDKVLSPSRWDRGRRAC